MKTPFSILTLVCFLVTGIIGPVPVHAQEYPLPAPGVMVHLSPPLEVPILKGIKVHPDDPFRFDFILDKGDDAQPSEEQLKEESGKLIKYFLASLTIPEKDLWVNLSPYEKDRIIPQSFGLTEMGRDLLAEDYMLKQVTASLIYPEDEIGKKFWKRVYQEAYKRYGTTNIPVNTFNKVWIIPEKAVVYENSEAGTAYIVESKLKVMLEEDYLSLAKHEGVRSGQTQIKDANQLGSQIVREVVIPELTKEINEDKNFARLRQVYNSLILAVWYKKKIKDGLLSQAYTDQNKVFGININDAQEKEKIYQRYLQAFKKGVYNFIKEDVDPATQESVPRKYFSGGVDFAMSGNTTMKGIDGAMTVTKALSALRKVFDYLNPRRLLEVKGNYEVAEPLVFTSINVPEGYRLIGGEKNPVLAARLQRTTGLTAALIGPGVYSPAQDNQLTLKFMDVITANIKKLDAVAKKDNTLKILVIGSGSGLDALTAYHQAKQKGFRVELDAIDIKNESIENTRKNFELLKGEITDQDKLNVLQVRDDGRLEEDEINKKYDLILFNAPDAVDRHELLPANEDIRMDQDIFKRILQTIADRLLAEKGLAIIGNQKSITDVRVIVNGKLRFNQESLIPGNLKWEISGTSEEGVYLKGQQESRVFFEMSHKDQAMSVFSQTKGYKGAKFSIWFRQGTVDDVLVKRIMDAIAGENMTDVLVSGRSIIINLPVPILIDGKKISQISVKGVVNSAPVPFDDSGNKITQPVEKMVVRANGKVELEESVKTPQGTMLWGNAQEEYIGMRYASEKGVPTGMPIGFGQWPWKYSGQKVGFVVIADEGPAKDFTVGLRQNLAQIFGPDVSDKNRSMALTRVQKMVQQASIVLRQLHQAGVVHKQPRFHQFSQIKGKVKIYDFETSSLLKDIGSKEFDYRVLTDVYVFVTNIMQLELPADLQLPIADRLFNAFYEGYIGGKDYSFDEVFGFIRAYGAALKAGNLSLLKNDPLAKKILALPVDQALLGDKDLAMKAQLEQLASEVQKELGLHYESAGQWFLPYAMAGIQPDQLKLMIRGAFLKKPYGQQQSFPLEREDVNEHDQLVQGMGEVLASGEKNVVITSIGPGEELEEPLNVLRVVLDRLSAVDNKDYTVTVRVYDRTAESLYGHQAVLPFKINALIRNSFPKFQGHVKTEVYYGDITQGHAEDARWWQWMILPSNFIVWRNTWVMDQGVDIKDVTAFADVLESKINGAGALIVREYNPRDTNEEHLSDPAFHGLRNLVLGPNGLRLDLRDAAMKARGGIDLTPANMNLQTQNNGKEIRFHVDVAMLQKLQHAPGIIPVIINVQPLKSLAEFLNQA